jgi:hypothetical protein
VRSAAALKIPRALPPPLGQDDDLFLSADEVRHWCGACLGAPDVDRAGMDDLLHAMGRDPARLDVGLPPSPPHPLPPIVVIYGESL